MGKFAPKWCRLYKLSPIFTVDTRGTERQLTATYGISIPTGAAALGLPTDRVCQLATTFQ